MSVKSLINILTFTPIYTNAQRSCVLSYVSTNTSNIGSRGRDEKINALKFLLTCMVILDHVIMALCGGKVEKVTFNFIYSFHMPLFVFTLGYFTRPGEINVKSFRSAFHFFALFLSSICSVFFRCGCSQKSGG